MATSTPLPPRPRLVFRTGFAGRRDLTGDERAKLADALRTVFATLEDRLVKIVAGAEPRPLVADFFAQQRPLLRLVTGLCEGADSVAMQALTSITTEAAGSLETELAAVLPFDIETYRDSRPKEFHAEFDRQVARCAWVLTLDGRYEKPNPDTPPAARCRARAYRAQSAFLLRHSDLLIAAANPDDPGEAGGTMETVREALVFELPVIFIHTGTGEFYCIRPEDDFHSILAHAPLQPAELKDTVHRWINQLTADPDNGLHPGARDYSKARHYGQALLTEFFDRSENPSRQAAKWAVCIRKGAWHGFEKFFRSGPDTVQDEPLPGFFDYRERAIALGHHYSAIYRGAFLLNYALAVVTVTLAAVSLTVLAVSAQSPAAHGLVLILTFVKLAILVFISRNTRRANRDKWNDRAVDYRYLAERLRGMYYLPLAGSHQPPASAPPQFAPRAIRQSAVDWLFDSVVRAVSPAGMPHSQPQEIRAADGSGKVHVPKVLTIEPGQTLAKVRNDWIGGQANYHECNSATMHNMHHWTERAAYWLGMSVIVVVAVDLVLVAGEFRHWFSGWWLEFAETATPLLICVSAVLPAFVAALGGMRFQSECQRLSERSAVMRVMLKGRIGAGPGDSRGRQGQADVLADRIAAAAESTTDWRCWSRDTLGFVEQVATDFVQEAAEWSVLYAREVSDPG